MEHFHGIYGSFGRVLLYQINHQKGERKIDGFINNWQSFNWDVRSAIFQLISPPISSRKKGGRQAGSYLHDKRLTNALLKRECIKIFVILIFKPYVAKDVLGSFFSIIFFKVSIRWTLREISNQIVFNGQRSKFSLCASWKTTLTRVEPIWGKCATNDVTYLSNLGNLIVAAIEGLPEFFRQSAFKYSNLIMYPNSKRKHLYF